MLTVEEYRALTPAKKRDLAAKVAKQREAGMSGNELRETHGAWLTGPTRIRLLREFGHGAVVGKSYDEYRDGGVRTGGTHAREHGANSSLAQEAAQEAAQKAEKAAARKAKREAKKLAQTPVAVAPEPVAGE